MWLRSVDAPEGRSNSVLILDSRCAMNGRSKACNARLAGTSVKIISVRKAAYSASSGARCQLPGGPAASTSLPQTQKPRAPARSLKDRRGPACTAPKPSSTGRVLFSRSSRAASLRIGQPRWRHAPKACFLAAEHPARGGDEGGQRGAGVGEHDVVD